MNKSLIIAELFILRALRSRFLPAMAMIFLPFLIGAWIFEISNPGFQTTFAVDAGSSLLWLFSALTVVFIAYENLFWKDAEQIPWFLLTRSGDAANLIFGNFMGIAGILFLVLLLAAGAFFIMFRIASGIWTFALFFSAFMVYLEIVLLSALLIFLSTFCSRVMTAGGMILAVFVGHSLESLRLAAEGSCGALSLFFEPLFVLVPDLDLFKFARLADLNPSDSMIITMYAAMMSAAYLCAAAILMRRHNY